MLAAGLVAGGTVYTADKLRGFARGKYEEYKFKKATKSAAEEPTEEAEPVVEEIPTVKAKKVKG